MHETGNRLLCTGIFLFLVATACTPAVFDVGEVVGEVTGTSARVFTQAGAKLDAGYRFKLGYGPAAQAPGHDYPFETPVQSSIAPGERVDFNLEGLLPDQGTYYSVAFSETAEGTWTWGPERSLHTPRSSGADFRFCVVTDLHYDGMPPYPPDPWKARVTENVAVDAPDFVVTIGDVTPVGNQGAGEPVDCSLAYGALLNGIESQANADYFFRNTMAAYLGTFAHSAMVVWVNGNHEGLAGYLSACPQYPWVLNARKNFLPFLDDDEPNALYGDLVWGDVHIIWIDPLAFSTFDPLMRNDPTGYVLGAGQRAWLEETLAGSVSKWKLLFAHTLFGGAGPGFECAPRSSYARGNANHVYTEGTDQIVVQSLMETYGADAYIYGHDHVYSVSEANGVKYICAASGQRAGWAECLARHYLPWTTIDDIGHLRIDVEAGRLTVRFIRAALAGGNGDILDVQILEGSG